MPSQPAFDLTICHHMETGTTGAGETLCAVLDTTSLQGRDFRRRPPGMCDTSTHERRWLRRSCVSLL